MRFNRLLAYGVLINDNVKIKENIEIGNITVIDSMMGSGKTSWAIQEMNTNKEKSYIFVTPFLSEIDRIKKETDITFYEPIQKGEGKLKSFHELLAKGTNIAVTHKLFTMINDETREFINQGKYILIIDEVIDVIELYNEKVGNIIHMKDSNTIDIDENDYVVWKEEIDCTEDYDFYQTKIAALNKCLIAYSDTTFLWQFPPDVFDLCEEIYIMTYGFEGSALNAYFKTHNLTYNKKQILQTDNSYILIDYTDRITCNYNLKQLITICEDEKLNDIGKKTTALSANWYKVNKNSDEMKVLKNNITNYLKNKNNCTNSDIMWTTYSEYEKMFEPHGGKFTRHLSKEEKNRYTIQKQAGAKLDDDLQKLKCFVPCNSRATNIYRSRSVLIYAINYYPNTIIKNYFKKKNTDFDSEQYALNGLIQWVWRSRIRNGEPISIYIPSSRMRTLFREWLSNLSWTPR